LTATLDGLGAVGDGAHARHEHLRLEASLQRAALLALLLMAPPLGGTSEIESP
jgi:glutamate carboxypeptidase